jgi:phospholipase/carboxylesterase
MDFSEGKPVYDAEQAEQSRTVLIKFIQQIKERYAVDPARVYLCGFSQGAIMSYSVALTRPDLVTGIAAMSGRLLEEIKPLVAPKEKLQHLDIYIAHGTKDPVLPIQNGRDANAFLQTKNLHPVYHEYPEGHTISTQMLTDFIRWLK